MSLSQLMFTAVGMVLAPFMVLTLASVASWVVDYYLLQPFQLQYLRTLSFILLIAALVQFVEMVVRKTSPLLHQVLGIFLPLITSNCAVLGVALLNQRQGHGFLESAVFGFGAALGFSLVLILFAGIRERMELADVPRPFQGSAIALITAGLLSLGFMGFTGLVRL